MCPRFDSWWYHKIRELHTATLFCFLYSTNVFLDLHMDFERISFNRDKLASSIILILIIFLASTIGAGILDIILGTILHPVPANITDEYIDGEELYTVMTRTESLIFRITYTCILFSVSSFLLHKLKFSSWGKFIVMSIITIMILAFMFII